jgi:hypothetical protein
MNPPPPPPGYQPPQGYPQPQGYPPQQGYPPPKKSSPLVWILVIVGVVVLLGIVSVGGVVFYGLHKLRQAGVDPALMRRNPALAAAKIAVKMNPDVELIQIDEDHGTITVRDRKTGKVLSANFDNAKNGKWSVSEDGKTTEVNTSGPNGSIEVKGPDGTVKLGGGAATNIPSWVPQYPGSKPENAITSDTPAEMGGVFHFKTKDSTEAVLKFYTDQVKAAGLTVANTTTTQGQGGSGGFLTAADDSSKRSLTIAVGNEGGENSVAVTYETKK